MAKTGTSLVRTYFALPPSALPVCVVRKEGESGHFCKRRAHDEAALTRPNGCQNRVQQIELNLGRAHQNVTLEENKCVRVAHVPHEAKIKVTHLIIN